jgi:hypothetical protein
MNIKEDIRVEKTLNITENDVLNGGEVLVLVAYAIKENEDLYSFPSPQIFSKEIYEKNKTEYDNAVKEFRAKCE